MKALHIVDYGKPLEAKAVADPTPAPDEVVVMIEAAGICRSDVHYRAGTRPVGRLPLVPGHEVAGTIDAVGTDVSTHRPGDRVCLHYLVTCGHCEPCLRGAEQFCRTGAMIGLDRQGGYAEALAIPARNAHHIPDGVSTEAAAVMMCSTSTSLHALRRGGAGPGTSVAVFGAGGLGMSAIQLAAILQVNQIIAIDTNPTKLATAVAFGATPVDGNDEQVAATVREASGGGVDVALELVGSAPLMSTAVASLRPGGHAVAVGITDAEFGLDPYRDLIKHEASIVGAADHLSSEIDELLVWADAGRLDIDRIITKRVVLDGAEVDAALDRLEAFGDDVRTVIVSG